MEQEIEDMINKDEMQRMSENAAHEKAINLLTELNADY